MSDKNFIGTDLSNFIENKKSKSFLSLETETSFFNVLLFIKNTIAWVIWRTFRIFGWFLSGIIFIQRMIINLRSDTLQVFYWGRSNVFGIFLQSVLVFIGGITIFSFFVGGVNSLSRAGVFSNGTVQVAADTYSSTRQDDVLVETGSLETVLPEKSLRSDVITYVAKSSDNLQTVADAFGITVDSVRWANNIKKDGQITAGQELKIPQGDGVLYVVQNGDNLDSIAAKFKSSAQAIGESNRLDKPVVLVPGKELYVPSGVLAEVDPKATTKKPAAVRAVKPVVAPPSATRFLSWPVQGGAGHLSQCPSVIHMAIDIAQANRPNLVAAAPGVVTYAGYHQSGYAWVVEIDHGNGYTTLYAHMTPQSIIVHVGDFVDRGQVLGRMGDSGLAYGVHVHFEVANSGFLRKSKRTLVPPPAYMIDRQCGY